MSRKKDWNIALNKEKEEQDETFLGGCWCQVKGPWIRGECSDTLCVGPIVSGDWTQLLSSIPVQLALVGLWLLVAGGKSIPALTRGLQFLLVFWRIWEEIWQWDVCPFKLLLKTGLRTVYLYKQIIDFIILLKNKRQTKC